MAGQLIRSLRDLKLAHAQTECPSAPPDYNNEVIIAVSLCFQNDNENGTSDPDQKAEQVVVQIELLKPTDQFGLSTILFDNPAVKCHLVSNGAECVLIKKSWFLQHANEAMLRKLRNQIPPYPSQAKLEQKMQDQANWDSFKTQTINTLLDTLHL
ncbi:uncharacterized protein [Montipora foliosa]|uniref:uncharacterized protein n=1 Tax=Montipora foliosa TaxID=591990 RepID=UPI0035F1EB30